MPAPRFRGVQLLRFFASLLVVWAHAIDTVLRQGYPHGLLSQPHLEHLGAIGVDIFFVISGFIIATTCANKPERSAKAFLLERFIRVAPIYFLLSLPWIGLSAFTGQQSLARTICTFLFWPAFQHGLVKPYLGVGWTLCFEMLFYLAFSLTLLKRRPVPVRVILTAYAACAAAAWFLKAPPFNFIGSALVLEFLGGVLIAVICRNSAPRAPALGLLPLVVALVWIGATAVVGLGGIDHQTLEAPGGLLRVAAWGTPAALLVLGAVVMESGMPMGPAIAAAAFLGDASYSLYLTHPLFMLGSTFLPTPGLPSDIRVLILIALSICAGVIVHLYLEKPLVAGLRQLRAGAFPAPIASAHLARP
jgi:exopolysaccharide production protein ExoZ